MVVDRYTKFVLTVIAVALTALALQPLYLHEPTRAAYGYGDEVRVVIRDVDLPPWADALRVECTNCQ